jgi:hypothetical protein
MRTAMVFCHLLRAAFGSGVASFRFQVVRVIIFENVKLETYNMKHLNEIRFTLHRFLGGAPHGLV